MTALSQRSNHPKRCSQQSKRLKKTVNIQIPVKNGPRLQCCNSLQTGLDCRNIMWVSKLWSVTWEVGVRVVLGMDSVKIRLVFLSWQGKKAVKVWRFNPNETENVTLEGMEEEILPLFPDIQACGLRSQFKYRDSLVGTIVLETDSDVQVRKYSLALLV